MFDFSLAELLLTAVVAVVFIGPKELPVVLRAVAKGMRSVKALGREIHDAFDQLAQESGVKDVKSELEQEMKLIKGDDGQLYESYDIEKIFPKPVIKDERPTDD